jgi:hypothetical protein
MLETTHVGSVVAHPHSTSSQFGRSISLPRRRAATSDENLRVQPRGGRSADARYSVLMNMKIDFNFMDALLCLRGGDDNENHFQ